MEYRQLGRSGLKVSALSFGAATFGGSGEFFKAWGETGVTEATRLVSICNYLTGTKDRAWTCPHF
jgi:aryl-alcohol dehydrogenase-like predicted oxidoreductase